MQTIYITVKGKFATCTSPDAIVANNTDWQVEFDLDEEWESIDVKFCRFYYNDYHYDKQFTGNTCNAPEYNEYKVNDGPEPEFIALGLFAENGGNTSVDPIITNLVYLRCAPSLTEVGDLSAYGGLENLLYMTTNTESTYSWKKELDSTTLNIQSLTTHSVFNSVEIDLGSRQKETITVPLVITNDQGEVIDEEWGKDYLFSYVLDYGYNCAFWWTYEIDGVAYWKSNVMSALDISVGDQGTRMGRKIFEAVALQPTNMPKYRLKKELKLHVIGTFGDELMTGGKLRLLNVKVLDEPDTDKYKPAKVTQDNYIRTDSRTTALHKWIGNQRTVYCSSHVSERGWVIINPFESTNDSSKLQHFIYASKGNSLFPQNVDNPTDKDAVNWSLEGIIFNTSQKESVFLKVIGYSDNVPYYLVSGKAKQNSKVNIKATLNYENLPTKLDYIVVEITGGNDGNNTILYENLRLLDLNKNYEHPVEYIVQNPTAGNNTKCNGGDI